MEQISPNRDTTQAFNIDSLQKQVNIAQEVVVDLDFSGIDNLRKLFKHVEQEKKFIDYLERERNERIIKLAKLTRSKT